MVDDSDEFDLVGRAARGEELATATLFARFRGLLRLLVARNIDPRVRSRIDASDVVQEAMLDAFKELPAYERQRPMPFQAWLRRVTWERLMHVHRQHIHTQARSVCRERTVGRPVSDSSDGPEPGLISDSPSQQCLANERERQVHQALNRLSEGDREILRLRFVENVTSQQAAARLNLSNTAFRSRQLRALIRFKEHLHDIRGASSDTRRR